MNLTWDIPEEIRQLRQEVELQNKHIEFLDKQNKEMKELLKTIYDRDCLPWFAFDKGDDEESIVDKVRKFMKESK